MKVLCDVFTGLRLPLSEYLQMPVRTNAYGHHPPPVLFPYLLNQVLEGFPSIQKAVYKEIVRGKWEGCRMPITNNPRGFCGSSLKAHFESFSPLEKSLKIHIHSPNLLVWDSIN